MSFKCQNCGAEVIVYENTTRLTCGECASELIVERRHGTIAVRSAAELTKLNQSEEQLVDLPSVAELNGQLQELKSESSRVLRRQLLAGIVGGLCGIVFGYVGVTGLIAKELGIGITMLLCSIGSFWFVRFVMRDSTTAGEAISRRTKELEAQIASAQQFENEVAAATRAGLDRTALELYLKEVLYYPSWIEHSRDRVPAQIEEANKTGADAVRIKTSRTEFLFEWESHRMKDGRERGELTVSANCRLVLRVRAIVSQDQWLTSGSDHSVLRFVEGPWVEELFGIWSESKECMHKHRVQ